MDPETLKLINENQKRADAVLAKMQPLDEQSWEARVLTEEHDMESQVFEWNSVVQSENFGIKQYKDSVFKGELINGKRHGLGVCIYRTARLYEG